MSPSGTSVQLAQKCSASLEAQLEEVFSRIESSLQTPYTTADAKRDRHTLLRLLDELEAALQNGGLQSLPELADDAVTDSAGLEAMLLATREQVSNLNSHLAQVTMKNARASAQVLQKHNPANDPSTATTRR